MGSSSANRFLPRWSPQTGWSIILVAPAVIYLCIFQVIPILIAGWISLTDYDLLSSPEFVGLKNYRRALQDPTFLSSAWITFTYVFFTVVPVIIISFFLAQFLSKLASAKASLRIIIFLPTILPLVSVALVWRLIFNFEGPLNDFLGFFGLDPVPWLTNSTYAPWALILMSWWHASSYYTIMFLAGFMHLPKEVVEAAKLDGASGFKLLWFVTLPLMRPTVVLVTVMASVNGLKAFVFQKVITDGGPADSTEILTLLIYKTAFSFLNMGRASAYSIMLFAVILGISLIQIWIISDEKRGRRT